VHGQFGAIEEGRRLLVDSRALCREIAERRSEGYALHRLGLLAEFEDDRAGAEAMLQEALTLRRSIAYALGVTDTCLALGRLLLASGATEASARLFAESRATAERLGHVGFVAMSAIHAARIDRSGLAAACDLLAAHDGRIEHLQKMEARLVLWQLTKDRAHVVEAKRLLDHLVAHAPAEFQGTMVGRVALYREIAAAAKEAGL
jgi:hypothetical protein